MILVGHHKEKDATYIGRGSPLGNPYKIGVDGDRDQVCDLYEQWLRKQVQDCNAPVLEELARLAAIHRGRGKLILGCYCNTTQSRQPKRCHGYTIKKVLEEEMQVGA